MATPRHARVTAARTLAPDTRLVELVCDQPLGFVGGQYVIVDTGEVLPSGKAVKRAYSLLSDDTEQTRIELAVKRIPDGPASGYLHRVEVGATVRFSGPWGKLAPAPDARGRTVILATDTGITAALGLVRGARFRALAAATTLIWLRVSADDFLPEALVRTRLPAGLGEVEVAALPPIGHPERVPVARAILAGRIGGGVGQAFLAGDGAVNYALLDDLVAAGVPASRDSVESFFNMPRKAA